MSVPLASGNTGHRHVGWEGNWAILICQLLCSWHTIFFTHHQTTQSSRRVGWAALALAANEIPKDDCENHTLNPWEYKLCFFQIFSTLFYKSLWNMKVRTEHILSSWENKHYLEIVLTQYQVVTISQFTVSVKLGPNKRWYSKKYLTTKAQATTNHNRSTAGETYWAVSRVVVMCSVSQVKVIHHAAVWRMYGRKAGVKAERPAGSCYRNAILSRSSWLVRAVHYSTLCLPQLFGLPTCLLS